MGSSGSDGGGAPGGELDGLLRALARAPDVPPGAPAPGARVDRYELVELLGAGGMGVVFRARDPVLGREVALKLIRADAATAEQRARFAQEARALAAVSHPNVVAIHDVGVHDGAPFLALELLRGESLRQALAAGPLEPARAIRHARDALAGLAAAHARGIVHRDLKPENLFVTADGTLRILDFGLAKRARPPVAAAGDGAATELATSAGTLLGTTSYMAPEQVRGAPVDARTDLFALGAVLYELVCGRRAFAEPTPVETMHAILHAHPPPLDELVPGAGAALAGFVDRCLAKDPAGRFGSADEAAEALAQAAARPEVAASGGTPLTRYARSGDTHLAYQVVGHAPRDLLAIAGFVSSVEQLWEEEASARFFRTLAREARLVLFDKRGTGQSDRVAGVPTLDDLVADTVAVMDAAGAARPVVFGVSEGVPVALRLATRHPDRVAGLVLFGGFPRFLAVASFDRLRELMQTAWGTGRTLEVFAPSIAGDPRKRRWWGRWERMAASPGSALAYFASMGGIDATEDLPAVRAPTLVIHRRGDRAVPVAASEAIAARVPGARLAIHDGDDHLPMIGDGDRLAGEILAFCRAVDPREA